MKDKAEDVSRRRFLRSAAAAGATAAGLTILGASARGQGRTLTACLVGCGGRGNGAARNFLEAGRFLKGHGYPDLEVRITAVADAYGDRAGGAAGGLKVPRDKVFVGYQAYRQALDSGVDILITATPPAFRPVHFAAAIEAGKHAFFEKPVAVDPPGARKVMEAGELAKKKGLAVVAGTQRRHSKGYTANAKAVLEDKVIGRLLGGRVSWCGGALWKRPRQDGWSNREYLVRNWVSFTEMSGDHIVEQHVHNLDVCNWFMQSPPVAAIGFGGRARRETGDQFDFFSVDLEYPGGIRVHSTCRQVNGCAGGVWEYLVGEKGTTRCGGGTRPDDKNVKIEYPEFTGHGNPYVNEHVDLIKSILAGDKAEPINEATNVAQATLTAIMSRMSTYTGQRIAWKEVMDPNHKWGAYTCIPRAADFEKGEVPLPKEVPPVPGRA